MLNNLIVHAHGIADAIPYAIFKTIFLKRVKDLELKNIYNNRVKIWKLLKIKT